MFKLLSSWLPWLPSLLCGDKIGAFVDPSCLCACSPFPAFLRWLRFCTHQDFFHISAPTQVHKHHKEHRSYPSCALASPPRLLQFVIFVKGNLCMWRFRDSAVMTKIWLLTEPEPHVVCLQLSVEVFWLYCVSASVTFLCGQPCFPPANSFISSVEFSWLTLACFLMSSLYNFCVHPHQS